MKKPNIRKILVLNDLFPDLINDQERKLIAKAEGTKKHSTIELPTGELASIPDSFDMVAMMDAALDPVTGTLRNLKIDDRDLPQAKNYYDFSYRIIGRDSNPPWARQMWTGLMIFAEVCTYCTDPKYLHIDSIPKKFDSQFIPDVMTILEHGICPKCGRHKWDLIKNHGLRHYQQLVNVLGQRSGKSASSAGGYCPYMVHQYLKFPTLASLSPNSMQASTLLTGTFVSLNASKAIGLLWTPFKKFIDNSQWFCIAAGEPVSMADGTTKPIETVLEGDLVKTFAGIHPVTEVFDNGVQNCFTVLTESGRSVTGTAEHQVRCLSEDGLYTVEKQIGDLTVDDFVVIE